jgi:autotransporter-associated beta strand protein
MFLFSRKKILLLGSVMMSLAELSWSQIWSNNSTTYPPGGTQNWTTASNWSTGVVPATASTPTINGQGYALINSTVNTLATFGVLGTGEVSRGLYIASGGALTTTGTFRLANTNGNTTVEVASGGTLTIGSNLLMNQGTGAFGRLTTAGQTTVNGQTRVETQTQLYITGGNFTSNQASNTALFVGLAGSTNANQGLVVQSGGNFTTTSTGWLQLSPGGTYQISGGNMTVGSNSSLAMYFNGANATSLGGTFRVVGSGAQTINFGGLRYQTVSDQTKATWGFTLDNSANHISKLNFLGNGNAGGYYRLGTLDVQLQGGVLLSGTNSFVLLEAPSVTTLSNYTNSADYTGATAKLWTQGLVDSTRDQITVSLTGAGAGTLNYTGVNSLTQNGTAYGYVNLGNVTMSEPMTVYLKTSGGTLSNFTTALTNAGVTWSSSSGEYDLALTLSPSTSGGTYFAYDLAKIDAGMTITGLAVDSTFGVGSGNSSTISSDISGGGGLVKNGDGTLILTGANTYNGTTRINAGTLQIGSGGTSGSLGSTTPITVNGTLAFNRSDAIVVSNTINGSGGLLMDGSGSTAVTGTNAYSGSTVITAGTLSIGNGGTTGTLGSGNVTITGPGVLSFERSNTLTVANAISGNGTLRQAGSGTLQLTGSNTNAGAVVATSGTILFDGANALSGSVSQLSATNATLSLADGTARTTTLSSGDLSLDSAGFIFDIGATSDRLTLSSGSATMAGTNTVKLNFLSLISAPGSWTLVSAASGLNGVWSLNESFTGVVQSGFTFSLASTATTLTLTAAASANDYYWKGNLSGNWSETSGGVSNWTGDAAGTSALANPPGDASDVYFSAAGAANLTTSLGGNLTVKTLSISDPSGVTIQAGNTLTANSSSFAAFNISAASGTTTINASLAGTNAGLNKSGGGTLILGGANTYGGGTTISAGTLTIHADSALGATSGGITVNPGAGNSTTLLAGSDGISLDAARAVTLSSGTLLLNSGAHAITVSGNISGSGALTKSGAGTAILDGSNTFTGGLLVDSGTLAVSGGNAVLDSGTVTLANSAGVVFSVLGSETIGSLQGAGSTGGEVSIAAAQTLTVAEASTTTFAGAIAATGTLAMGGTGNLTLSNVVSGSGGLSVSGSGSLLLTANNTLGGTISIQSGTLRVGSGGTSGSLGSAAVSNNATLVLNRSNAQTISNTITGSGAVVHAGSGTTTLSGSNSFSGGVTLSAGTVQLGNANALGTSGAIAFTGGTLVYGDGITTDISARLGSASSQTIQINTGSNEVTFASGFGGAGSTLTKTGSGQLLLSGSNAYSGFTTVSAGNLRISNGSALGSTAAGTVVSSGASLEFAFTGNNSIGPEALTLNGSGIGGNGAMRNISGNTTVSQFITLMGSTTIQSDSGTLTLEGSGSTSFSRDGSANPTLTLKGNGNIVIPRNINIGTGGVVIAGNGTVTIGASNVSLYSGATTIQSGTLVLAGAANSLSVNSALSMSGGTLQVGSNSQTFAGITLAGGTIDGTTGLVSVNAPSGFALQNGTVSARLGGNASLTKSTAGTVTLSGNNSFSGNTTVNAGSLVVAGQNALGSTTSVVVNNGGSLLVTAGNSINNTAGLTLGGGTLGMNGTFNESVGALTLTANSIIDLNGFNGTLTFYGLGGWSDGTTLAITNWSGLNKYGTPVGSGIANRHVVFTDTSGLDSYLNRISFYSGDFGQGFAGTAFEIGFTGQIAPVPEPETWATAALLLAWALFWAHRRCHRSKKGLMLYLRETQTQVSKQELSIFCFRSLLSPNPEELYTENTESAGHK